MILGKPARCVVSAVAEKERERSAESEMAEEERKTGKLLHGVRIAKAVTTLAVVALPVMVTLGAVAGYGACSLIRRLRKTK